MQTISNSASPIITTANIQNALDAGQPVILPTETVFGLAANADNAAAIDALYAAKARPEDKPIAVAISGLDQAQSLAEFDSTALELARKYWPGSLTLVLPAHMPAQTPSALDDRLLGGSKSEPTIALRCPDTAWRTELRLPLALTSANRSGEPDSLTRQAAIAAFDHEFMALDTASNPVPTSGTPSTIIALKNGRIHVLRQGDLHIEDKAEAPKP